MSSGSSSAKPLLDPTNPFTRPLWAELELVPLTGRVSTRLVDHAFAALEAPSAQARLAWKVLRDVAYQDVYRRFGTPRALLEAGFLDDLLDMPAEHQSCWTPGLVTPFHKLARKLPQLPPGSPAVVLLATGAFAPVHLGHLEMMEAARAAVQLRGGTVVGGYLSPSHDHYVDYKQGGAARMPIAHRLALCHEAVASSDWLMVDAWEGRYAPTSLNFTDVIRRLEGYLRQLFAEHHIEVVYVFGGDNIGFLAAGAHGTEHSSLTHPKYLCVKRGADTPEQALYRDNLRRAGVPVWCAAARGDHANASSTRIRAGDLTSQIPRRAGQKAPGEDGAAIGRYLVRDDLRWSLGAWSVKAQAAAGSFTEELCRELENAFAHEGAPPMRVLRLPHEPQVRAAQRVCEGYETVVSLDAATQAPHQLRLSRRFGLADGQVFSREFVARPGAPAIEVQVQGIPAGEVFLLEDDIATGATVACVRELLAPRTIAGIELLTAHSLRELGEEGTDFFDVVDVRDFLLGTQEGGLVVQLPSSELGRAPYMLPWVSNVFRAKLPTGAEVEFSRRLWSLNVRWLRENAPEWQVKDAPAPARRLLQAEGFWPDVPLWLVAQHYERLLGGAF